MRERPSIDYPNGGVDSKTVDAVGWVSMYEYDAQNRLGHVLIYERVGASFKLNHRIQYQYNTGGELQLTRHTIGLAYGSTMSYQGVYPVEVRSWERLIGLIKRSSSMPPNYT
ncbi:hypothetical protein GO730_02485 [Spirosoma sp. HMF3257]|uniref:Uncharacterized protein n=1 Tax=Spirosoma telluris TaxID=2183553 RepID=A0A327NEL5_9BACT|nr:hypothetical protein [Spirosoma telluris]RAI73567.1 hypothetical protein HMF3257_02420 [Spirosoma telluris]